MTLLNREVIPLFHPRRDRWVDHFRLAGETHNANFKWGGVTVRLLRLNAPERLIERHTNLRYLSGLIIQ